MRSPLSDARDFADKVRSYMGNRAGPPSPPPSPIRERGNSQYGVSDKQLLPPEKSSRSPPSPPPSP